MGGKLTEKDMDQLEQWIGTGPKTFTLLYAITTDGCNATTFHQKCDNQGATVTVLYNPQGSVYGGYAPVSWTSSGTWINNNAAFLYQLRFNGNNKATKFTIKPANSQYTLHDGQNYGPLFGGGNDLRTFEGTVNSSGTYFTLNGYMNLGHTYDNQGITKDQINNGNMNVTELEVYKVADGKRQKTVEKECSKPWRKTRDWNEQFLNELTEDIVAFKPLPDLKVTDARILIIGPVGAGKSSFYNTINSVFRGRITQKACSGSAEQSLTTAYTPYKVKVKSGAPLNFRLCDTRGLEESQGLDVLECNYLLDGNIPNYYQFNPTTLISPKTPGFKASPTTNDVIHCAVFVLDATTLEVLSTKIIEKMKGFQNLMNQKGIPQIILLTKIDKLCNNVEKDVSLVFKSPEVEQHVEKASQLLGLPRANVLPVKNYENENELDDNISILALLALRQILYFAEDFLDHMLDKKNDEQSEMEKLKLEN
ncbi:interferon-induced protein 44-like isoform X1 [Mercenaria mercenaria]|uniref:interferon-induced protein 44-like isoform X1 n=1 Tax=Mercenaria mercenaria TaxID=6596 RepID=UPI00234E9D3C|nr:interferon-induced protein 44-like isoform X1 [Mercenaria mercenaria]XP_053391219.1 interferon-induced protein 44-like isoform X1 [Mercenaria mercenaria]